MLALCVADFETHARQTYYVLDGLKQTTFSFNSSFSTMNMSVNNTLVYLVQKAKEIDLRLKELENRPQQVLTEQIEDIHHQVSAYWVRVVTTRD